MDQKNIDRIVSIISAHAGVDEGVKLTSRLDSDLGLDSLDIMEVVIELEDEFDIELGVLAEDELCEASATVQTAIDIVLRENADQNGSTL